MSELKHKGLYPYCINKDCGHSCALRVTEELRRYAKSKNKKIITKDICTHVAYENSDNKELKSRALDNQPAHDFKPFLN